MSASTITIDKLKTCVQGEDYLVPIQLTEDDAHIGWANVTELIVRHRQRDRKQTDYVYPSQDSHFSLADPETLVLRWSRTETAMFAEGDGELHFALTIDTDRIGLVEETLLEVVKPGNSAFGASGGS